jgi:aminoglycoside/choline kinase family phosphotransferase
MSESAEIPTDIERLEALLARTFPNHEFGFERIPAGLGDRRFYRIELDGGESIGAIDVEGFEPRTLIARIEPDPDPAAPIPSGSFTWLPEPPIEPIRTLLEAAGLPVPRSYAHDPDRGIDLLEDLGSKTLADVPKSDRRARYLEAGALITRLQSVEGSEASAPAFGRFFDASLIRTKAAKVLEWSWPGLLNREASKSEREAIESGFEAIARLLLAAPPRLAHRDFKAENLHLTRRVDDEREQLVMIDVQGAFMAPPEYDLVCLLRDLQVELPEDLVEEVRDAFLATLSDPMARKDSLERFEAISVVRLAKDVAHIVHAARTRGDSRRWHEIPRGLELLGGAMGRLAHTCPSVQSLNFVIHTLTQGAETSDIGASRQGS